MSTAKLHVSPSLANTEQVIL